LHPFSQLPKALPVQSQMFHQQPDSSQNGQFQRMQLNSQHIIENVPILVLSRQETFIQVREVKCAAFVALLEVAVSQKRSRAKQD
jgi:hypothetical protein